MRNPIGLLMIGLAKIYQIFISPLKPPLCRFRPTCSEYFVQAVRIKGPIRGTWMAILRIARCHPFCEGGFDPVLPDTETRETKDRESAAPKSDTAERGSSECVTSESGKAERNTREPRSETRPGGHGADGAR